MELEKSLDIIRLVSCVGGYVLQVEYDNGDTQQAEIYDSEDAVIERITRLLKGKPKAMSYQELFKASGRAAKVPEEQLKNTWDMLMAKDHGPWEEGEGQ